jgi:hypothetical protein
MVAIVEAASDRVNSTNAGGFAQAKVAMLT